MKIRIVISGRNYELAEPFPESLELPDGSTLDDALGQLSTRFSEGRIHSRRRACWVSTASMWGP